MTEAAFCSYHLIELTPRSPFLQSHLDISPLHRTRMKAIVLTFEIVFAGALAPNRHQC